MDVYLVNRAQEGFLLLAPETKDDASVPERKFRTCGASGVAAYIVAAWMAAGDKSDKKEVCRGRGTRPKLMGAVKHPAETWVADASSSLPGGRYPIRLEYKEKFNALLLLLPLMHQVHTYYFYRSIHCYTPAR